MSIGSRLKRRADDLNLRQNELAKRLGISPTTLNGYFNDYREPDIDMLKRLASSLDTTVEYLIEETDDPNPPAEKEPTISDEDKEVIEKFKKLSLESQMKTLGYMDSLTNS
jgi:transcriptional regulator with XRE-family HTH domain